MGLVPHIPPAPPVSSPCPNLSPVGGGPAASLSSRLAAARPDIIPCAAMTVRGLLLLGSWRCRGLYRGAPPGNTPGITAPECGTCKPQGPAQPDGWCWEPVSTGSWHCPAAAATAQRQACAGCLWKLRQGAAMGDPHWIRSLGCGTQRQAGPPAHGARAGSQVPASLPCLAHGKSVAPHQWLHWGGRTSSCPLLGTAPGMSWGWRGPWYLPVLHHLGLDGAGRAMAGTRVGSTLYRVGRITDRVVSTHPQQHRGCRARACGHGCAADVCWPGTGPGAWFTGQR